MRDTSAVYCTVLESIREYIAGGDILIEISDVAAINSTIVGNLVPAFCSTFNQPLSGGTSAATGEASAAASGSQYGNKFGPGIAAGIGVAVGLIALALIAVHQKRRRAARAEILQFHSNSGSDVEHQINLSPLASHDGSEGAAFSATSLN